jgi:SecD/SecF fusion protein
MLQVQLKDLIKALADDSQDADFLQALEMAQQKELTTREDFITLFEQSWEEIAPGKRMSAVFGTYEMREKITPETSNADVIKVIREEAESAIANSFNVLRNRIDRFGVTQPNIQKLGNTGRILVELPGVKEPERVRKLLQGTASLEFWPTFDNAEVYQYLAEANAALRDMLNVETEAAEADSTAKDAAAELMAADSLNNDAAAWMKENPLFAILNPSVYGNQLAPGACIGRAHYKDTALINTYLNMPQIQALLPGELKAMWTVQPSQFDPSGAY